MLLPVRYFSFWGLSVHSCEPLTSYCCAQEKLTLPGGHAGLSTKTKSRLRRWCVHSFLLATQKSLVASLTSQAQLRRASWRGMRTLCLCSALRQSPSLHSIEPLLSLCIIHEGLLHK